MIVDPTGNAIVSGNFQGDLTMGNASLTNGGLFLIKCNRTGNVLWSRKDGDRRSNGTAVGLDSQNNIYVLCDLQGTGGASVSLAGTNVSALVALAKYDAQGQGLWARPVITSAYVMAPLSMAVDGDGNSVWSVFFWGAITIGETNLSADATSGALVKCDPDGRVLWVRAALTPNWCTLDSPAFDSSGNIYVCGNFGTAVSFGTTNLSSLGPRDAFLAKYTGDGDLLWVKQWGGDGPDGSNRLAVDSAGNCFVQGRFFQTAMIGSVMLSNNLPTNFFCLIKYDPAGGVAWARQLCQSSVETLISVDASGNCYFAVNGCDATNTLYGKYDPEGNLAWSKLTSQFFVHSLRADSLGHCYIFGQFWYTTTGATFDDYVLTTTNTSFDVVLAKLGTTTAPQLTVQLANDSVTLLWPVLAEDYYLESTSDLRSFNTWTSNGIPPVGNGLFKSVTADKSTPQKFYRLVRP